MRRNSDLIRTRQNNIATCVMWNVCLYFLGIGLICTWMNHTQVSSRFSEKETLLIYGISSLLSLATPIIFGLCSDKSAQPKKASCYYLIWKNAFVEFLQQILP